jgi:protein-tyrosine phosphatase
MNRLRTIVQLTQNFESGRRKADAYFPNEVGKSVIVSPEGGGSRTALKVTLLREQLIKDAHCVHSTISITPLTQSRSQVTPPAYGRFEDLDDKDDEEDNYGEEEEGEAITIQHLLYTAWPDQGVPEPEDREGLLAFLHLVDSTNRDVSLASRRDDDDLDPDPPIVVGCSAGVGRTGSFIALSSLLRHYKFLPPAAFPTPSDTLPKSPLGTLPRALRDDLVAQEIDSLREQRPGMVQREEQIILIYEILAAAFG